MITGIHWPENSDATWQVVVHLYAHGSLQSEGR